jgi:cytochrome c biogenesis protein CcmG/thiol:disulfide interchange protein DsbE
LRESGKNCPAGNGNETTEIFVHYWRKADIIDRCTLASALGTLVFAAAAAGSSAQPADAAALVATIGQQAPAFVLEDLAGSPVSARMLLGKPLYINVFATWCPPCRAELPEIVRSYVHYKDRVTFLGVDEQEPAEKIEPFTRTMGIHYRIAIDQGQMEASYRAHSVPTSVFIDRRGVVRALYRGPIPNDVLQKYLRLIAAT